MTNFYKWWGGRKVFIFYLLLLLNAILAATGKFRPEFGNFCIMLYGVVVAGNVGSKYGKKHED